MYEVFKSGVAKQLIPKILDSISMVKIDNEYFKLPELLDCYYPSNDQLCKLIEDKKYTNFPKSTTTIMMSIGSNCTTFNFKMHHEKFEKFEILNSLQHAIYECFSVLLRKPLVEDDKYTKNYDSQILQHL